MRTLPLPGVEFAGASPPEGDRSPGLVVEFIGGSCCADILNVLTRVLQELRGQDQVDCAQLGNFADTALVGLQDFNGLYADDLLATVADRLRLPLQILHQAGGGG